MTQRGNGKRQDSIDQGIRSVSLECIFCFPKWKFEIIRRGLLSHVTATSDRTYNARTQQNDPKRIWRRCTNWYKNRRITKKNTCLRKKGIPPSPQVSRNLFNNVRSEIKILSQTHTNYIGRPSAKRDYTFSLECHIQPLSEFLS